MRILVIEDEPKVLKALKHGLTTEGYEVCVATTGEEGFFIATAEAVDIIVLDRMLPGRDGLEILATLREKGNKTPVLVLTARDSIDDRVDGLDAGADDYLVKPFSFAELLARIRALLRRGRSDQALRLRLADLEVDFVTRKVTRAKDLIVLTAREFEVLAFLLRHGGQIVTRAMLAHDVWGEGVESGLRATPLDNVIDVQIARLRKKIDEPFARRLLHTVRGVGFVLKEGSP